jgi:c(7)-type cytochrome triheme protein
LQTAGQDETGEFFCLAAGRDANTWRGARVPPMQGLAFPGQLIYDAGFRRRWPGQCRFIDQSRLVKHRGKWQMKKRMRLTAGRVLSAVVAAWALLVGGMPEAQAEYGDVVINNYSDKGGVRPAVFPHWFHRIRFTCKVCHADLGFKFKAGGNDITMAKIVDGQFCGACHNGEIAWSVENCNMCHSGVPGMATQFHNSTQGRLYAPGAGAAAPAGVSAAAAPAAPAPAPAAAPAGKAAPADSATGKKRRAAP